MQVEFESERVELKHESCSLHGSFGPSPLGFSCATFGSTSFQRMTAFLGNSFKLKRSKPYVGTFLSKTLFVTLCMCMFTFLTSASEEKAYRK